MMKKLLLISLLALLFVGAHAKNVYVVSIGISDYKSIGDLKNADNDAREISRMFLAHTPNVTSLVNSSATKECIIRTMKNLFQKAKPKDTVIFFFSGHGSPGGLCTYDTDSPQHLLTYQEIQQVLQQCKAKRKILLIDACFAGGLRSKEDNSGKSASHTFRKSEGVLLFLSSRTGEVSAENIYSGNGLFTQYLVKGLKGGADVNADRIITAQELYKFVSAKVKERSHNRQNPVMWGKFDDNMEIIRW